MIKYIDKNTTYIEDSVKIEDGVTIYPNVVIEGKTKIGKNSTIHMGTLIQNSTIGSSTEIGMNCYIKDSMIGNNSKIQTSHIEESEIGTNCEIGPYTHIRPHNIIKNNVKIGSFVELKNNSIGTKSKIPHLSYIGDATIGENVNISCGVITANFNGKRKQQTIIEDNTFIGCNTNLIAPIYIQKNSIVEAGITLTEDVSEDTQICNSQITTKKRATEKI